jgi:TolB-like protein
MDRPFPAYKGDAPYIFVSYSHADSDTVYPEIKRLHEAGFNIWYDEGISPGSTWRDEVALALTQSKLFLYFISPGAIRSENCLQELNFALSRERKVLAVHLEPTELTMGVELSLSNKQAIMRFDHPDNLYFDKLQVALESMMPKIEKIDLGLNEQKTPESTAAPDEKSIAILPFTNRSSDEEIEYLCDGVAEELIGGLSKLDDLRVASQLSTFALKNQGLDIKSIGEKLNVSHVFSGSIQKSGNRVRVNVSLNDVVRDHAVWSERYDGTLDDVFAFQENVARNVVDALEIELGSEKQDAPLINVGTSNAQAYNAFLLGMHSFMRITARDLMEAIEHFEQAVSLDPGFGRPHFYIGLCNSILASQFGGSSAELIPKAKAAIDAAAATDFVMPYPRAHFPRMFNEEYPTEPELALEAIEKIRNPDEEWQHFENWQLGLTLGNAGFLNGEYAYLRRYLDMAPAGHVHELTNFDNFYTSCLALLGRFEEEIEFFSTTLAINPDQPLTLGYRAMAYSRTGQYSKAESDLKELAKVFPRNFPQFYHLFWTRQMDAAAEYYAWLESQPRLQPLFKVWGAYLLGDVEKGLDYQDAQIDAGNGDAWALAQGNLRCLPQKTIQQVREHPRYKQIVTRFGITDDWPNMLLERVNELTPITGIAVRPDEEY